MARPATRTCKAVRVCKRRNMYECAMYAQIVARCSHVSCARLLAAAQQSKNQLAICRARLRKHTPRSRTQTVLELARTTQVAALAGSTLPLRPRTAHCLSRSTTVALTCVYTVNSARNSQNSLFFDSVFAKFVVQTHAAHRSVTHAKQSNGIRRVLIARLDFFVSNV